MMTSVPLVNNAEPDVLQFPTTSVSLQKAVEVIRTSVKDGA